MKTVKVQVKRDPGAIDLPLPSYQTDGAAGMDLCAAVEQDVTLAPGEIRLIPTGISVSLPGGFEAQIRPRSGLSLKHGVTLVNAPGTIDCDYRGVISLPMINHGSQPYVITRGARLAQMVIQEVIRAEWVSVEELTGTSRAAGGFGHTGI